MYYGITLTLVNFSRFLDEIGATQLASVSGRYASFKYECDSRSSRKTTSVFHINHSFSWQSIDLFLRPRQRHFSFLALRQGHFLRNFSAKLL